MHSYILKMEPEIISEMPVSFYQHSSTFYPRTQQLQSLSFYGPEYVYLLGQSASGEPAGGNDHAFRDVHLLRARRFESSSSMKYIYYVCVLLCEWNPIKCVLAD